MQWYHVIKRIKGRRYHYWQKTYREGGIVKTLNRYIGPVDGPAMSMPDPAPKSLKPIQDWVAPVPETRVEAFVEGRELQDLETEVSIMQDVLADHPGKELAKRYNLAMHRTGNSLGQLNHSAAGKSTASTYLDSFVTELGFKDVDEAERAIETYNAAVKRRKVLALHLKELRRAARLIPRESETEVLDEDGLPVRMHARRKA
jgi:hypothetical protein